MKRNEFFLVVLLIVFGLVYRAVEEGRREIKVGFSAGKTDLLSKHYRDFPRPEAAFSGIDEIVLDNPAGTVEVAPAPAGQTTLNTTVRIHHDDPALAEPIAKRLRVETRQEGKRLTVTVRSDDEFPYRRVRVFLSLRVPTGATLDLKNRFGRVDVLGAGRTVRLDGKYGDIRVEGIAGPLFLSHGYGTLRVARVEGRGQIETKYSTVDVQDVGELSYSGKYATTSIQRIKGLAGIQCAYGPLTLDTAGRVELEGKHSKITLRNVTEGVRLENSYEEVALERCGGSLQLAGKYCRMRLTDINADSLVIENAYNQVSVDRFSGKTLDIVHRNGDLKLKVLRVEERITVDARYANVEMEYPAGLTPTLSLSTRHGDIRNHTPRSFGTTSERDATEVSVAGNKPEIHVKAAYGNIELSETLLEKMD